VEQKQVFRVFLTGGFRCGSPEPGFHELPMENCIASMRSSFWRGSR